MNTPTKYTKKPVDVEVMLLDGTGEEQEAVLNWIVSNGGKAHADTYYGGLVITTLEGQMHAGVGWYIIKGVQGEFYPCKPDIFEATYSLTGPFPMMSIPIPLVQPTGMQVNSVGMIQEVWDTFVKPTQSDNAPPQSVEVRTLMAILRSMYAGLAV